MAKHEDRKLQALMTRRDRLFQDLLALSDMVDGNLVKIFRRCGKPGCKCAKGQKHGPAWALLYKDQGHSKMVYVPKDAIADGLKECRRRTKMYARFKTVYKKILGVNRQILKLQLVDMKGDKLK